jgi:hypothetical protein
MCYSIISLQLDYLNKDMCENIYQKLMLSDKPKTDQVDSADMFWHVACT